MPAERQAAATFGNFSAKAAPTASRRVEISAAPGGDLGKHAARNNVARGQFGILVQSRHEAHAGAIDQSRAFAAQGFGGERRGIAANIDGGRVELHEFGVGDAGAGPRPIASAAPSACGGLVVTA